MVIDGGTDSAYFYINGIQKGSVKRVPSLLTFEETANFIGKPLAPGFPTFRGDIHEIRIHDKPLQPEKVQKSMQFGPDMLLGPVINLFQVDKEVVRSNDEVTFTWNVSPNATVSIEPSVLTEGGSTGSIKARVADSTSFNLIATDEDGTRSSKLIVVVDDRPIINSFSAEVGSIQKVGEEFELSWDVSHADFLQVRPDVSTLSGGIGKVSVPLYATTQYTLLARNRHGSTSASIEVKMPETGPLRISEFLADNDEAHADDFGDFSDWIEVLNTSDSTQDLSRWSLSDSDESLKKWTFPASTTLGPGARILIHASGKNTTGPGGKLHSNFKLDPDKGGFLSLTRDDGLVGSIFFDYPLQRENVSYGYLESGKLPSGGKKGDRAYFTTTTPAQANTDGYISYVNDTKFSHDRGFYENPFTLEITTSTAGALIYYTLDGSEPSASNGIKYTSPFVVSTTSCVRARAYLDGYHPTDIDTQTYVFLADVIRQSPYGQAPSGWPASGANGQMMSYGMDPDIVGSFNSVSEVTNSLKAVSTMSIVTDLDNLFDASQGIYVNAGRKGINWERPASLELIHPDGSKGFQINMGLRMRGGYSRTSRNPKHSFRIFFRGAYGQGRLKYPLFEDEGADRFDKFDFRTSQNYSWAFGGPNKNTMVREVFSRDTQGAMGWPYTRSRYYHIYLNGVYWGIFQTQERVGPNFCSDYLGGDPEDYDVLKQGDNRDMFASSGSLDDYYKFWEQANAGFATDAAYYKAQGLQPDGITPNPDFRKYLDPDNLIDYMIITYWTADRDGPGSKYTRPRPNNYYCFFNRNNPDGFKFMEHDSEHSLGANVEDMVNPLLTNDPRTFKREWFNAHWLHERLTDNKEYVVRFYDRVYKHLYNDGVLTAANSIQRLDKRAAQIDQAIIAESARWGDQKTHPPRNRNNWLSDVQAVRNWINNRESTFLGQLRGHNWYPATQPPSLSRNGGEVPAQYELSFTSNQGTIYYTLDGTDPRARGGAPSPAAQKYSKCYIFERPSSCGAFPRPQWQRMESALRETPFLVGSQPATAQNLAITEINYNPSEPSSQELTAVADIDGQAFEYLELQNLGSKTISLGGVKFVDGVNFTFGDLELQAGKNILIVKNQSAFEARYGTNLNIAGEYEGSLRNSGETLELVGSSGVQIRKFSYGDSGSWPGRADGKGSSLEIIDPKADADSGSNWRSSSEVGGTPGNEGSGPDNRIVINEVLTHTDLPLKDSIELFNTTDHAIDMSGWFLSDSDTDFRKFKMPSGTILPANSYLVFTEDQFNPDPENPLADGFALSSAKGDHVWLMQADAEGNLQRYVDHVDFTAAANGESFGRWPNATGKLVPMATRSLGKVNSDPRVGPLVVTEIHYNPHTGVDAEEFLEIANPTHETVPLVNWKLRGGVDFDFPAWATLPAGGIVVLVGFDSDDPYKAADFKDAYDINTPITLLGPWTGGNPRKWRAVYPAPPS